MLESVAAARTIAVVPLKTPVQAKTRLSAVLDAGQRRELQFALAERTLAALHDVRAIDTIAVVTASEEVSAFARARGAVVLMQKEDTGMRDALAEGMRRLPLQARLLMIAGDLPLISAATLRPLLTRWGPGAVLVPDRHHSGTNALLCTPPQRVSLCFGPESLRGHLEAARSADIPMHVLENEALALDLDTPDDLQELQRRDARVASALLRRLQQSDVGIGETA